MKNSQFKNKNVLITAGPTREAIDPVRFISNHSSGKMGYAIAEAFLQQGAKVVLVSGPVGLQLQHPNMQIERVVSASDMYLQCCRHFEMADIVVFAAAVADYRPEKIVAQKIKKACDILDIRMVKNIDIAAEFGLVKMPHQLSIGFALETNDELANAASKLRRKNFDMVVLNSMNDANAGFGFDTNKVSILKNRNYLKAFSLTSKKKAAGNIVAEIAMLLNEKMLLRADNAVDVYERMCW